MTHTHVIKQQKLLSFILAGHAIFTAKGREHRFTYKVFKPTFNDGPAEHMRWVYILTGPNNTSDYEFFGSLVLKHGRWEFRYSNKARIKANATSIVAFEYIVRNLVNNQLMPQVEVWHEGRCGRCGDVLTVPESIELGFGPVCAKKVA